jgi:hypothetical protein
MIVLSLFLFALAAVCNAVMDTLHHHFETSIFKDKDPGFWNTTVSWERSFNLFGDLGGPRWVTLDAWHIAKFVMLFSLAGAVITFPYNALFWFPALVLLWGAVFELFYSYLLRKKS